MVRSTRTRATEHTSTSLQFNKSLLSTPQAPIATKDVLIRLQQLHEELAAIDIEDPDLATFSTVKDSLVNPKLLKSNNAGVQAYVCCCLADLFRIYAPDAPFTADQLSMIFKAFFNQFKKLTDVNNPYFPQQCYLLKRLAEVRSTILITDLKDAEELTETIFNVFYDLSNKEFPQKLEPLISDILSDIMAEAEVVPHNVLKLILDKLIFNGDKLASDKISNPGFNFSVSICEANVDRMSRQVAQYFSEMLYESSKMGESTSSIEDRLKSSQGLDTLKRIHKLSVQIWRYVPGLLYAVMGLIDEELNADDETIRVLATETIGQMIASSQSFSSFMVNYKDTWTNWLKKSSDISSTVRCKWVEQIPGIINGLSGLTSEASSELCSAINKSLLDVDEKVRLVSCVSVEKVSFDKFTRVFNKDTMVILSQLIREKNSDVRKQAITILSNQCNQYFNAVNSHEVIDFGDKNQQESLDLQEHVFKEIPNQLLSLIYINNKEINSTLDICFFEKILPFEDNTIKRVNRLCQLFSSLNEKSRNAFFAINQRQQKNADAVIKFIELCEEYGKIGSLDDKENMTAMIKPSEEKQKLMNKLEKVIRWFCDSIPEGLNSALCFERFYKLKNFRFHHLMKLAVSPDSDFITIKNAMRELLTKLSAPRNIRLDSDRTNISTTDMVSTFKLLMYRSSIIIYNKSNILELINYSKNEKHEWNTTANELLNNIAVAVPGVLKNHIDNLVEIIEDVKINQVLRASCLKTLYQIVKKYPDMFPGIIVERLKKLCLTGSPNEAKYATKLVKFSNEKYTTCLSIADEVLPIDPESPKLITHMATVAELLLIQPDLLDDKISDTTAFFIKNILLTNEEATAATDVWISDTDLVEKTEELKPLLQKLLTFQVFTNRLRSLPSREVGPSEFEEITKPVIKLFHMVVSCGGEIVSGSVPTPPQFQSRLRLAAGLNLLKLAKYSEFDKYFTNEVMISLAYLLQDQSTEVRSSFLKALQKELSKEAVPDKFLVLMCFMNNEPNKGLQFTVEAWLKSSHKKAKAKKETRLENALVRLIHLVSHSDKFDLSENPMKSLEYAAGVIIFFLNHFIDAENISLLYYLASRVKQFRDATIDQDKYHIRPHGLEVTNLYTVAELSQLTIKEYGEVKGWSTLSWPGKIQLPKDLFAPMQNASEAQAIISKVYIKEDLQIPLRSFIRQLFSGGHQKKRPHSALPRKEKAKRPKIVSKEKPVVKTVKPLPEPTRKSNRTTKSVNYATDEESDDFD